MAEERSYHGLYITTPRMPRVRLFDLPYDVQVRCSRASGWTVWRITVGPPEQGELLGGEYDGPTHWLVLDVAGHVICDSRPKEA